jgi:hypothetical protein
MPLLPGRATGSLLPMRVGDLTDTTIAGNWALWLRANDAHVNDLPGPWLLDIHGNTVTQDPRVYGAAALSLILRLSPTPHMMAALHLGGYLTCTAEDPSSLFVDTSRPCCVVLVDATGRHPGDHTNGVFWWGNTDPYVEGTAPDSQIHRLRDNPTPVRRVGMMVIPESDIERLVRLRPGQRITGLAVDPIMQAVQVRVEGDGLPVHHEMSYPERVDALRYQAPPLVERVDVGNRSPALQHATVLQVLADLIEHAGHLGAAHGVVPDLSVNAHAGWIGADEIARRHAPDLEDRGAYQPSKGHPPACRAHVVDVDGQFGHATWPCPDYRAAALAAVTGLATPDDE